MVWAVFAISDDGTVIDPSLIESPVGIGPPPPNARSVVLTISGMLTALLIALLTVLPLPYVIDKPGPTFDMFGVAEGGLLLSIDGVPTYPPSGELRLTTVGVQGGPEAKLAFGAILRAWLSPTATVVPIFPADPQGGSIRQQWISSQEMATLAALSHQGIDVPATVPIVEVDEPSNAVGLLEVGDVILSVNGTTVVTYEDLDASFDALKPGDRVTVTVDRLGEEVSESFDTIDNGEGRAIMGVWVDPQFDFPFDVTVAIDNVGGPSGGTMFALGIIDLLTPEDELQGAAIAGTGTIDIDGNVGPIGGIALKMAGAAASGSDWFLAPASNCPSVVGRIPDGLNVVAVSTLDEAYDAIVAIGEGNTASLPSCA